MKYLLNCAYLFTIFLFHNSAYCEELLKAHYGNQFERLGNSVRCIGDFNNDGINDYGMTYNLATKKQFDIYSGATHNLLYSYINANTVLDRHKTFDGLGDVDGDGYDDVLIALYNPDHVEVISGRTQAVIYSINLPAYINEVNSLGDLDNDGIEDFAVAMPTYFNNVGSVRFYSGANGNLIRELVGSTGNNRLGTSIESAGDVDGDNQTDIIVAAKHSVRVYSGSSFNIIYDITNFDPLDAILSVTGISDLNQDGCSEFTIADWSNSFSKKGYVNIYSGKTGALIKKLESPTGGTGFGFRISSAGDINGDGLPDLFISDRNFQSSQNNAVYIYSGKNGEFLFKFYKEVTRSVSPWASLGYSMSSLGDINQDGKDDFIFSDPDYDDLKGAVYLYSTNIIRSVAFESVAQNLSQIPNTTGVRNIIMNNATNTLKTLSLDPSGALPNQDCFEPSISKENGLVAFQSGSQNLIQNLIFPNFTSNIFITRPGTGFTKLITYTSNGYNAPANHNSFEPVFSGDGFYVAYSSYASDLHRSDTDTVQDIFLHNLYNEVTDLISTSTAGIKGNKNSSHPSISEDGRYIVFESEADNLTPNDTNNVKDIFVKDRETGITERISRSISGTQLNGDSTTPKISADGRYVTYVTMATNTGVPVGGHGDIFIFDRQLNTTTYVSTNGSQVSSGACRHPDISDDGNLIVFESDANNLVSGDNNNVTDIFIKNMTTNQLTRVNTLNGQEGNGTSNNPSLSPDGQTVTFDSMATNFSTISTNGARQIYSIHLASGNIFLTSRAGNTSGFQDSEVGDISN